MKNYTTKTLTLLCAALFFLTAVPQAFANDGTNSEGATGTEVGNELTGNKKETVVNTELLGGFNFGIALGLTMDIGSNERVESAEVVNGIVRVTKEENDVPRIMLETHYFFTPDYELLNHDQGEWGIGPFVGIQNGSNEIIEYIGAGVMLGFRRTSESTDSFNIGIGVVLDPSVKILGDGIEENQPLPTGETAVRYKETSQLGLLAMISYGF
ncbi:hypothetical protein H206_03112 [Candidatus Electrothrix aarhusensis]|uniref:Outer membrane protein beta-barrel domain-containing protein n=1 Tax=Candidatus Electrothrix aarhusensis TaxID=1859131 RepID=A0A444J1H2_9BACT|nr:hypothetical protein H206_03112 [Candidatus Electrothrix aarhusensis]